MATNCTVIQFLEPDSAAILYTSADDHSLPIEEGGSISLVQSVQTYTITFVQTKLQDDYDFTEATVVNTIDPNPLELNWEITAQNKNGFTVVFDALPDTNNYKFNWRVRVISI